jgi:hypothetical protein
MTNATPDISPALGVCPNCGLQAELMVFLMQPEFADSVRLCLDLLGTQGNAMLGYLGLFKPAKHRMTPKRLHAALLDLVPMINAGSFKRNGNTYTAPRDAWSAGMQAVLAQRATIKPPLTSHAYLLTVMASMMDGARDKATAKADAARESEHRNRMLNSAAAPAWIPPNDDGVGALPEQGVPPTDEQRAAIMQSLANLSKKFTQGA